MLLSDVKSAMELICYMIASLYDRSPVVALTGVLWSLDKSAVGFLIES